MNPPNERRKPRLATALIAAGITCALLLYLFTFQVRMTQRAVVTTFGKPSRSIEEPGLYGKWPYPFQDVYLFDTRIQVFKSKLEEVYTQDQKNVIVLSYVGWCIESPMQYLVRVHDAENAQRILEGTVRNFTNSVIAQYPFQQLVSADKKDSRFDEIVAKIERRLNYGDESAANAHRSPGIVESYGMRVKIFGIERLMLPKNTTTKVFERMSQERIRLAESLRAKGDGKAREIRTQADAQKRGILIEAEATAKKKRGEGDAQAATFYATFAQDVELAAYLRKMESLEKIIGKMTTLVLDTRTQPLDLLNGPPGLSGASANGQGLQASQSPPTLPQEHPQATPEETAASTPKEK